jgi:hypothetical protein
VGVVGLDHVQLAAPPGCEDEARRFFGVLLGLTELPKPRALLARGGVWFGLGGGRSLHIGVEEDFSPARKAHPALSVAPGEIDALATRLEAGGALVRWDEELPVRRFFTEDPWGNRLEVMASAQ